MELIKQARLQIHVRNLHKRRLRIRTRLDLLLRELFLDAYPDKSYARERTATTPRRGEGSGRACPKVRMPRNPVGHRAIALSSRHVSSIMFTQSFRVPVALEA